MLQGAQAKKMWWESRNQPIQSGILRWMRGVEYTGSPRQSQPMLLADPEIVESQPSRSTTVGLSTRRWGTLMSQRAESKKIIKRESKLVTALADICISNDDRGATASSMASKVFIMSNRRLSITWIVLKYIDRIWSCGD
jgi:hypothetical protein